MPLVRVEEVIGSIPVKPTRSAAMSIFEEISRLVGHSSSNVTETVHRHQIRPVITIGAEAMDKIFANEQ